MAKFFCSALPMAAAKRTIPLDDRGQRHRCAQFYPVLPSLPSFNGLRCLCPVSASTGCVRGKLSIYLVLLGFLPSCCCCCCATKKTPKKKPKKKMAHLVGLGRCRDRKKKKEAEKKKRKKTTQKKKMFEKYSIRFRSVLSFFLFFCRLMP